MHETMKPYLRTLTYQYKQFHLQMSKMLKFVLQFIINIEFGFQVA